MTSALVRRRRLPHSRKCYRPLRRANRVSCTSAKQYDDPRSALADLEREAAALATQIDELERKAMLEREEAALRAQQAMDAMHKLHEEMRRTVAPLEQNEERFAK